MCIALVTGYEMRLRPSRPPPRPAHPPPGQSPPATTCPRHATETHRAYQWEIGCLVDGVGEDASHAHAPRFPYRLGINGTVWGFGLSQHKTSLQVAIFRLLCNCKQAGLFIATGMQCTHGLINYIDNKAKCRHLKKLTYKEGLCGRCFQSLYVDWWYRQSCLVFSTLLCELLPLYSSLWFALPPPPPLCQ